MAAQLMASPVFEKRGPLGDQTRKDLAVRGAGTSIKDLMARWGWDGSGGAILPVASIEPGVGKIKGVRWFSAGLVMDGVVSLPSLFPGAPEDSTMHVVVQGEKVEWPASGGSYRNVSQWMVCGKDCELEFLDKEGKLMTREAITEGKIGDVLLRVVVTLGGPESRGHYSVLIFFFFLKTKIYFLIKLTAMSDQSIRNP